MSQHLLSQIKIVKVKDQQAAGTSAVTSDVVDMQGFEGVLFRTSFGVAASGNTVKPQQGALADGSDMADLADTELSSGTSDEDVVVDIFRPRERYVRLVAARGTSSALGDIWADLYGPREFPPDNTRSGEIIAEAHASPAEGTA